MKTIVQLKIGLVFCLWAPFLIAERLPEKLSFTAAEHPSIQRTFIPLIKNVYDRLGVEIEIVTVPVSRGLKLVDQGLFDGDVVRLGSVIKDFDNLIEIPVPLTEVDISLYCNTDVACNLNVLTDSTKNVAIMHGYGFARTLIEKYQAQFFVYDAIPKVSEMFEKERFNYLVFVAPSNEKLEPPGFNNLERVLIQNEMAYHVLNSKHQNMLQVLEQEFKNAIKKMPM